MADPTQPRKGPMTEEELRAAWVEEPPRLTGRIQVVDYDREWPRLFQREADRIRSVLGERVVQLDHVGSTSVPGLAAKPIIERYRLFRERLRRDPADRAHYQRVKRELAQRDWTYVQQYADARTEVVEEIIARARALAGGGQGGD